MYKILVNLLVKLALKNVVKLTDIVTNICKKYGTMFYLCFIACSKRCKLTLENLKHMILTIFQFVDLLLSLQMSHAAATALCRCVKLQCEFYPSREATLCLDPYSGIGFALWCLCR